ncbi:DUF6429 family protein [Ramlibacter lithotrophicus]|nr:DUF6429 family protein [Ramlibacter lithotrophicus]
MSEGGTRPESEFAAYVEAAEDRLARRGGPVAERLRVAYEQVKSRFEDDLGQDRDLTVSRAAALMLVEAVLRMAGVVAAEDGNTGTSVIDEMALIVAAETLHDEVRVWKTIDYSITERWQQLGWIEDPRGSAKSLVLTPEGLRRVQAARDRLVKGRAA